MRYLIFADLHGSSLGLQRLKEAVSRHGPDLLICLGDVLYGAYDGDAGAVARYFHDESPLVLGVRGNCDYASDANALGFDLPLEREFRFHGRLVNLQHHPYYLHLEPGTVAMNGHTHVKVLTEYDGVTFLNPGSIAKPRDDCPGYALMDESGISLHHAENGLELQRIPW